MEALIELFQDIWGFLKVRKKYWLAHSNNYDSTNGSINYITQGSVIAPFIYSIF